MGNQTVIVIYDTDEEYIIGVNEYLLDYINERYLIFTFSNLDKFKEFCELNNNIDILVMAEYCVDVGLIKRIGTYTEILSEEKNVSGIQGYDAVYRYRKMCMVISDILNNYAGYVSKAEDTDEILVKDINAGIIAIYSPVNRCGKSTLCLKLADELTENRSLVIDLEEFSLINDKISGCLNISDLLYYYLRENNNFDIKLDAIVRKYQDVDIIPPVSNISDIAEINADIWADLILKIKDSGRYGYIVIDMSNMVGDIFKILKICDYVFIPYLSDSNSEIKLKVFFNYLENVRDEFENTVIKKVDVSKVLSVGDEYVIKEMTDTIRRRNIG